MTAHRTALALLVLLGATTLAPAQADLAQARANGERLTSLADEPLVLESIGLTIFLPVDSTQRTSAVNSTSATRVDLADGVSVIQIQGGRSKNDELTTTDVANDNLERLLRRAGRVNSDGEVVQTSARILSRNDDLIARPAGTERFYVHTPNPNEDVDVIHGVTVFQNDAGQFVIFQLITNEDRFPEARRQYEGCIASAVFSDAYDRTARRKAVIEAGVQVFDQLTDEDMRAVIEANPEMWERLYRPAPGGADADAEELGYRRTRASIGPRGELDSRKPRSTWSTAEYEEGYLVKIDMLLLEADYRIDSTATYFMSFDGEEEAWLVRMAIRQDEQTSTWSETGAREGTDLVIRVQSTGKEDQTIRPIFTSDGYINMVESYMLGPLLVRAGVPADFGFYRYQHKGGTVKLRLDSVEHPPDRSGLWRVSSVLSEGAAPQVSTYNENGRLLRTELPDGRIWAPIELARLYRLWESKGLPLN